MFSLKGLWEQSEKSIAQRKKPKGKREMWGGEFLGTDGTK